MRSALTRYSDLLRPSDPAHIVLLGQLRGVLDDVQLDDFRAALSRRPVVDLTAARSATR
jgi:hypothetical protein